MPIACVLFTHAFRIPEHIVPRSLLGVFYTHRSHHRVCIRGVETFFAARKTRALPWSGGISIGNRDSRGRMDADSGARWRVHNNFLARAA